MAKKRTTKGEFVIVAISRSCLLPLVGHCTIEGDRLIMADARAVHNAWDDLGGCARQPSARVTVGKQMRVSLSLADVIIIDANEAAWEAILNQ